MTNDMQATAGGGLWAAVARFDNSYRLAVGGGGGEHVANAGVVVHVVKAEGVAFGSLGQWPCSSFIGDGGSATAAALNGSFEVASHAGFASLGISKAKCQRV